MIQVICVGQSVSQSVSQSRFKAELNKFMKPTSRETAAAEGPQRSQKAFIIRKVREPRKLGSMGEGASESSTSSTIMKPEMKEEEKREAVRPGSSISTSFSSNRSASVVSMAGGVASRKLAEFEAQYGEALRSERAAVEKATGVGSIIAKQTGLICKCLRSRTAAVFASGLQSVEQAVESYALEDLKPFLYEILLALKGRARHPKTQALLEWLLRQEAVVSERQRGGLPTVF